MPFLKGHKLNFGNQYARGMKHTDKWKEEARKRMQGNTRGFVKGKPSPRKGKKSSKPAWNKGRKFPEKSGSHHWNWKRDRTAVMERHRLRSSVEWKNWRDKVFTRDFFTCQECGEKGVYIEPHHISPIRECPERMFDLQNGITLCRGCHKKTFRKETIFSEKYFALTNQR